MANIKISGRFNEFEFDYEGYKTDFIDILKVALEKMEKDQKPRIPYAPNIFEPFRYTGKPWWDTTRTNEIYTSADSSSRPSVIYQDTTTQEVK